MLTKVLTYSYETFKLTSSLSVKSCSVQLGEVVIHLFSFILAQKVWSNWDDKLRLEKKEKNLETGTHWLGFLREEDIHLLEHYLLAYLSTGKQKQSKCAIKTSQSCLVVGGLI